jgi:hypothetical protein
MSGRTANRGLTVGRRPSAADTDTYGAFTRRIVRAYARRVADGDVEALAGLIALTDDLDACIQDAVDGLRGFGYSWADIAARLGITRQGVWQRWGERAGSDRVGARLPTPRRRVGGDQLGLFDRDEGPGP